MSNYDQDHRNWTKKVRSYVAKVKYDGALHSEVVIGFMQVTEEAKRKSGVGAWSGRLQQQLVEIPFEEFFATFSIEEHIPFHQIKYFKEYGEVALTSKLQKNVVGSPTGCVPGTPSPANQNWLDCSKDLRNRTPHDSPEGEEKRYSNESVVGNSLDVFSSTISCIPPACWGMIVTHLKAADLASLCCASRSLNDISQDLNMWVGIHSRIFGVEPKPLKTGGTIDFNWLKRKCTSSEAELSKWCDRRMLTLSGPPPAFTHPAPSTPSPNQPGVLPLPPPKNLVWMDGTKAVTSTVGTLQIWLHEDEAGDLSVCGRKLATVTAHKETALTCLDCSPTVMLTGCTSGIIQLWSMDEMKVFRQYRPGVEELGVPTSCLLVPQVNNNNNNNSLLCASASHHSSLVNLWDPASAGNNPLISMQAAGVVGALACDAPSGHHLFTAGSHLQQWDLHTTQEVQSLEAVSSTEMEPEGGGGMTSSSALAHHNGLLGFNSSTSGILLFDLRCAVPVLTFRIPSSSSSHREMTGLHLDKWKVVSCLKQTRHPAGFTSTASSSSSSSSKGRDSLVVYDIRWCSSGAQAKASGGDEHLSSVLHSRRGTVQEPMSVIPTGQSLGSFKCYGHTILATTAEIGPCKVLKFGIQSEKQLESATDFANRKLDSGRKKKKGSRPKDQGRFPKRQDHSRY